MLFGSLFFGKLQRVCETLGILPCQQEKAGVSHGFGVCASQSFFENSYLHSKMVKDRDRYFDEWDNAIHHSGSPGNKDSSQTPWVNFWVKIIICVTTKSKVKEPCIFLHTAPSVCKTLPFPKSKDGRFIVFEGVLGFLVLLNMNIYWVYSMRGVGKKVVTKIYFLLLRFLWSYMGDRSLKHKTHI